MWGVWCRFFGVVWFVWCGVVGVNPSSVVAVVVIFFSVVGVAVVV